MNNYFAMQRLIGVAVILFCVFFTVVSGDGTALVFIPLGVVLMFSKMRLVDVGDEYSSFNP